MPEIQRKQLLTESTVPTERNFFGVEKVSPEYVTVQCDEPGCETTGFIHEQTAQMDHVRAYCAGHV